MNTIPFSYNLSKLQDEEFTTIRKQKMLQVSERRWIYPAIVENRITNEIFEVQCTRIDKLPLGEIPTELLLKDTDSTTRDEAIAKIQKFYRKPLTDATVFYVHYLKKRHFAKPCPRCGGYYPGDCSCGLGCDCDGCQVLRHEADPANHIHDFSSTRGDTEYCHDVESEYYGWEMLVMECSCGETHLVPFIDHNQDDEEDLE